MLHRLLPIVSPRSWPACLFRAYPIMPKPNRPRRRPLPTKDSTCTPPMSTTISRPRTWTSPSAPWCWGPPATAVAKPTEPFTSPPRSRTAAPRAGRNNGARRQRPAATAGGRQLSYAATLPKDDAYYLLKISIFDILRIELKFYIHKNV